MKKLNAGVIGLGVGERHIAGYLSDDRCNVVKICDTNEKKLNEVAKKYIKCQSSTNPEEILNDPNINLVSIASYDVSHAYQVVKAIENGKHVFVEKPICLSQDEFESIEKALLKNPSIKLSSNFVLRSSPEFIDLKNNFEKNNFGNLYYLEGDYNYGRVHKLTEGWRGDIPFYSVMHGGGIHLIDLLTWIIKKQVIEVIGVGNKIVTKNTKFKFLDMVSSFLKFEDDAIAKITANFGSATPHFHRLSLYGTKSTYYHDYKSGIYFNGRGDKSNRTEFKYNFDKNKKINVLKSFVCSILDDSKPKVTCKEVLNAMAISLAIEKSLNSRKWEKVNYPNI